MFVCFHNLICTIAMYEQTFVWMANATVVKNLEYMDSKTPFYDCIKLELQHVTSDKGT